MLFGVDLSKRPMKKSESMIDLNAYPSSSSSSSSSSDIDHHSYDCTHKKKRVSVPWTEDEHMRFLEGLQALGRSEWARIAREYVVTKNATQVASHAQKHFVHQSRSARKQCMRPSIFDMPLPLPPPPPTPSASPMPAPLRVRIPVWMHMKDIVGEYDNGRD
ncbi:hypothetical protein QJS04_geneDACA020964 [Acorus gramineus]|uniref:Uncharacterized protein n=1 Tax=Acorus gramineus TaxID=55184 RepID=A0AAV9B4L3_ACOGR|nr:hypothetical protein QJS04_geneDACA020964 [Acorus gramineus]